VPGGVSRLARRQARGECRRGAVEDVCQRGGPKRVEELLLGLDQERVEGTGAFPGTGGLAKDATLVGVLGVDRDDDLVDRELVWGALVARATAWRVTSPPSGARAISSAARRP
jgi:hypothetical protein